MKEQKILIDTDMGNDDIMAICMMLLNPNIKIESFTVTSGVSDAQIGAKNLLRILTFCNKDIPVAIGSERQFQTPLNFPDRDIQRAQDLTLLSNLAISEITEPKLAPYGDLLSQVSQKPFTILALAPLTNLADMVKKYQVRNNLQKIVLMGGGIERGNVPPEFQAEYNIALDPKSADRFFSSGIPITLVGIDATSQVPSTLEFKNRLASVIPQTKEASIIRAIVLGNDGDFDAFYDPLAASILADSKISTKSSTGAVSVIQSGLSIGKTVFLKGRSGNVNVVLGCNSQKFYDQVYELVRNN